MNTDSEFSCSSFFQSMMGTVDELPEHVRHLLLEPVSERTASRNPQVTSPVQKTTRTPVMSPTSDEEGEYYHTSHYNEPIQSSISAHFPNL